MVDEVLSPLNIPVVWELRPKKTPGISYHFFNERGLLFGNGKVRRMLVSCQVDLWTKGSPQKYKKDIKKLMKSAGFLEPYTFGGYEDNVKLYKTTLVFNYYFKECGGNEEGV